MMRKTIRRSIISSTIKCFRVNVENGEPVIETLNPIVVMGNVTPREALKAARDEYGKDLGITVSSIETSSDVYEISVADFIAAATKISESSEMSE